MSLYAAATVAPAASDEEVLVVCPRGIWPYTVIAARAGTDSREVKRRREVSISSSGKEKKEREEERKSASSGGAAAIRAFLELTDVSRAAEDEGC